ncbi:MAG: hypothetical protein QM784_10830 [Polyangiaceae bacterium]
MRVLRRARAWKPTKPGATRNRSNRFNRAEKLVHAPTHLLYIARSNVKLGYLVRAQEAYQQLIREQLGASAPQAFRDAQGAAERELAESRRRSEASPSL